MKKYFQCSNKSATSLLRLSFFSPYDLNSNQKIESYYSFLKDDSLIIIPSEVNFPTEFVHSEIRGDGYIEGTSDDTVS